MSMRASLLRSRPLSYKGWTLDKFKEMFLHHKRPIPVYKEVDADLIRREIERLFSTEKKKVKLLQEVAYCISRSHTPTDKFGMITPDSKNAIVLTNYDESPNVVLLLGIIREFAFRNIGGGTAKIDLDKLDFSSSMQQMIVFDLEAVEQKNFIGMIYGSYRFKICRTREDYLSGSVGDYFEFDEKFTSETRGELGRSLINPLYMGKSFDPVLFGLAYLKVANPEMVGFFGKITLYKQYELLGADKYFLGVANSYWHGRDRHLVHVKSGLKVKEGVFLHTDYDQYERSMLRGLHVNLGKYFGLNVPPIMAIYDRIIELRKISYFGAFRNSEFGGSTEVGISIHFADLKQSIIDQIISKAEQLLV